jgi:ElaA protein
LPDVRSARFVDLEPAELYGILRLRSEVFVVEQDCVFLDADGRDTDPQAVHCWVEEDGNVVACLRLVPYGDPASTEIGRVVTHPDHRHRGLATALMRHALTLIDGPSVLKAQARLREYYTTFGYEVTGPEFDEDGIAHVPMRREP